MVATSLEQQGRDLIECVAQAQKVKWFALPAPSLVQF